MIRTNVLTSLVLFFLAPALFSQIEINWEQGRAASCSFEAPSAFDKEELQVSLEGKSSTIFGSWSMQNQKLTFHPVVPFSPGLSYQIKSGKTLLGTFRVSKDHKLRTKVINLFPDIDTVPENLLKMHLIFSDTMGEQLSERYLSVTNETGDTLEKIFLPLQPELWNDKHNMLTLWLDPGRIKRDLGPNRALGSPLKSAQTYFIKVSAAWKDHRGYPLESSFEKKYVAKEAIRTKPDPNNWVVVTPKADSRDPLKIQFERPMDFILSQEGIHIYKDDIISGLVSMGDQQCTWSFVPDQQWTPGHYLIKIESRIEDLAGNNLGRLFDSDIIEEHKDVAGKIYHFLKFSLQ